MTYNEVGFRAIYHNFCVIELDEFIQNITESFPGAEDADGLLCYGYYDREAGMTLEVLANAMFEGDLIRRTKGNPDVSEKIRVDYVSDLELYVFPDKDDELRKEFADKLEILKTYDVSEEIEETRKMEFLDQFRDEVFIDDVRVKLIKNGLEPEIVYATITGLGKGWFGGILLSEPYQNFGWHEGENIAFFVDENADGELECYTNMNPSKNITREDLADGTMLKEAVVVFNNERTEPNFIEILEILRDSYVWAPCMAIFSDKDINMVEKMVEDNKEDIDSLVGKEFTTNDEVRLFPAIIQKDENNYMPVFSSQEEMKDFSNECSKFEMYYLDVIKMAQNQTCDISGIVLDPFSNPFVLEAVIFDVVEHMKSRIEEN